MIAIYAKIPGIFIDPNLLILLPVSSCMLPSPFLHMFFFILLFWKAPDFCLLKHKKTSLQIIWRYCIHSSPKTTIRRFKCKSNIYTTTTCCGSYEGGNYPFQTALKQQTPKSSRKSSQICPIHKARPVRQSAG